ncbi:hypothetical protein [Leptospira yasudae]|nr:hypothetical protein [Leptospira yasudae]
MIGAIALNLICASFMGVTGTCPMVSSSSAQDSSAAPCHGENGDSEEKSSSDCCSSEVTSSSAQPEFRFELQNLWKFQILSVLFILPLDFVLAAPKTTVFEKLDRGSSSPYSDFQNPLSLLQVFLI